MKGTFIFKKNIEQSLKNKKATPRQCILVKKTTKNGRTIKTDKNDVQLYINLLCGKKKREHDFYSS